ncbi:hypothetical protein MP228_008098 [Amoeboaphelidium protococcarum]|nr:hypothetical protein MP228_008098 [Amoeboaphelidium protococcarum]
MTLKTELLQFLNNFDQNRYIEDICVRAKSLSSSSLSNQNTQLPNAEYAHLLSAFNLQLEELMKMKKQVTRRFDDLEDQLLAAESSHNNKMDELQQEHKNLSDKYHQLEDKMITVGASSIKTRDHLKQLDDLKSKAVEAKDLLSIFTDLSDGNLSRLDLLKNSNNFQNKVKCCDLLLKLDKITREVGELPQGKRAREEYEQYAELFEQSIIHEYESAYKDQDQDGVKACQGILFKLKGDSGLASGAQLPGDFNAQMLT